MKLTEEQYDDLLDALAERAAGRRRNGSRSFLLTFVMVRGSLLGYSEVTLRVRGPLLTAEDINAARQTAISSAARDLHIAPESVKLTLINSVEIDEKEPKPSGKALYN